MTIISALPFAGSITGAELVPIVQAGTTVQTTAGAMQAYGLATQLSAPPPIGGVTPNSGNFSNLGAAEIVSPVIQAQYFEAFVYIQDSFGIFSGAGTGQSNAAPITNAQTAYFTTVAAGTGAILPHLIQAYNSSVKFEVSNLGANALLVYPPTGQQINSLSVNAGYSLAAGSSARFRHTSTGQWYTS